MNVSRLDRERPLASWYPDPEQRRHARWLFTCRYLPDLAHHNPSLWAELAGEGHDAATAFIQARWRMMEDMAGLQPDADPDAPGFDLRRVADLDAAPTTIAGRPAVLIHLPEPEHMPEAYRLAVILVEPPAADGSSDGRARVFAQECTFPIDGIPAAVLCEWAADGAHLNTGRLIPASGPALIETLADHVGPST